MPERAIVLDVPCGKGRLAPFLRELGPDLLVGADGSREMLTRAGDAYDARLRVDAAALPFAGDSVDLVVCMRLIHHFAESDDRRVILCELSRVARRAVIFSFYRSATLEGLRRRIRPKRPSGRFGLPLSVVRAEMAAAGLEPVEITSLLPFVREQTLVLARPSGVRSATIP